MNIEEIAFKDRKNLVQLNENDLLDIIEFLQQDRKQWINQFTQTHNESVKIQEENQKLKDELKNKPDTQITLQDDKGNKFILIQTERIDIQVELNKTIEKLFNNWNKLKEWLKKELGDRINPNKDKWLTGVYDAYRETIDKMQELQGSDESGKNQC